MLESVYLVLLSVLSVSPNPISQIPCNVCQRYNNPIIASNNNHYTQPNTVQIPALSGPLGNSLNQVLLRKILSNPSLQKIIDPNTRLYNQNGDEVQRQVRNTPNVINNYFIVPPEFFNLNDTNTGELKLKVTDDGIIRRPHKGKKRKPKDEESVVKGEVISEKKSFTRKTEPVLKKKKIKKDLDVIHEFDAEENARKQRDNPKHSRNENKIRIPAVEKNDVDIDEQKIPEEKNMKTRKPKPNKGIGIVDETINKKTSKSKHEEGIDIRPIKAKNNNKEVIETQYNNILKSIEIPTDIFESDIPDKRQPRGSKRNATKKKPEQKSTATSKISNIAPFPGSLNSFFPYMPMGNYYDPSSFYPYNFNQYYQYLDPSRNNNSRKNKKKPKYENRNTHAPSNNKHKNRKSETHTIEILLKPKKKKNDTTKKSETSKNPNIEQHEFENLEVENLESENLEVENHEIKNLEVEKLEAIEKNTSEKNKTKEDIIEKSTNEKPKETQNLIESETSVESREEVTEILMEKPQKVSFFKEIESSSTESYENFDKLENFQVLGEEDEVPAINNNDIINDYYPRFDSDDYYNSDAENLENLDNRYFYDTENNTRKKLDRYEVARSKKDGSSQMLENPNFKTIKVRRVDYNDNEDLEVKPEHVTPEHYTVKCSEEIRRVKIPPKNTRPKVENVETVYAGSKVAKYGVADDTVEDTSISTQTDDSEEGSGEVHPTYVIAKSVGRPEDYW